MEEAPQEEEDDVDMEDAPQDVGDAAAPGGGHGEEDLDPFLALFDEDEGDDVSEDGVEGGLAFPGAVPEISQDDADLLYGALEADSVAAAAVESTDDVVVPEEHAPPYGPPTVAEELLKFKREMEPVADALRRIWGLLKQVPPVDGGPAVGPEANAAENVDADLDDVLAALEVEAPTSADHSDSPSCVWDKFADVPLTAQSIASALKSLESSAYRPLAKACCVNPS